MKMTSTNALMHQVQTRPRSAAFIFHARRGLPRSPTISLRIGRSEVGRNVLQAMAAAADKAHRQHFGAASVQPIEQPPGRVGRR
jgi:hypothetical protein